MSAPTTQWEAQRDGNDTGLLRCPRCHNFAWADDMACTDDGLLCQTCSDLRPVSSGVHVNRASAVAAASPMTPSEVTR